jgi:hypothetical protein
MNGYLINEIWLDVAEYIPEDERIEVSRRILKDCVEHDVTDFEEDMALLEEAQLPYGVDIEVFFEEEFADDEWNEDEEENWNE